MVHFIEHIFYINLDKRTDRKEQFTQEMEKMNWKAERFPGYYYEPPKGIVGCTKSHLEVLKLAKEREYANVLICEDDLEWLEDKEVVNEELDKLFRNDIEFDVCFLAYNNKTIDRDYTPKYDFLVKTLYSTTASCYLVNYNYYDVLIELYERALPILDSTMQHWIYANDQIWKTLQEKDKWFCFSKRLAKQRDGFSDNANQIVSYDC
jgi:glycosyl transferase family 25